MIAPEFFQRSPLKPMKKSRKRLRSKEKINQMLTTIPTKFNFNLNGVEESSNVIRSIYDE